MSTLLDWAETAGIENLKQQRAAADFMRKEGVTTLTILLAGATGALAYAVKGLDQHTAWLASGALAMSLYLYALSAATVFLVMYIQGFPAVYNEPVNLYQKRFSLEALREVELQNLQGRINVAVKRNLCIQNRLNGIRIFAVCSPIAFGAGAWIGLYLRGCGPF
ncbi:MAG: hypothetical protein ACK5LJ_16015 [Paracoccus sp. (in: a-proteobacteria)]